MSSSSQETVVRLDRERRLKYRITDLRELTRRLGNIGVRQLLERLGDMDLDCMVNTLHVGLRHEEPKMRMDRAEELLQIAVDQDGSMQPVMEAIVDALKNSGVIGDPKQRGNAPSPETNQPGHQFES